jgi:hypothetical protein
MKPKNEPTGPLHGRGRLLARAAEIYHRNLLNEGSAMERLRSWRLNDPDLLAHFRPGWCDGRLLELLPDNAELLRELGELGLLTAAGGVWSEAFRGAMVMPVCDAAGAVCGFCRLTDDGGEPRCTVGCPTIWNIQAAIHARVVLAPSVLDAMALHGAGLPGVIAPTAPVSMEDLSPLAGQEIDLIDPPDPRLRNALGGFLLHRLHLPDAPLRILIRGGPESLAEALAGAKRVPLDADRTPEQSEPVPGGFAVRIGSRRYEVLGLVRQRNQMKATLRLDHGGRLFIDTVDFYLAAARRRLIGGLCRELEQPAHAIESEVERLMRYCERHPQDEPELPAAIHLTVEERKEAEAFGRAPELLQKILEDFEACGVVGEEPNKLLGYLAAVSRKLPHPLSLLVLSSSGAGKSTLQDAVLTLCPPEDVVRLTSLTGRALYYKSRDSLKHRILALEETAGAESASYAIRNLISAGGLVVETATRDRGTGQLSTTIHRVEGPTAVFVTTTDPDVDPETASRFFITGVDESREQTRAILDAQRKVAAGGEAPGRAEIVRRHHNFQRLLRPLRVINPHAGRLTCSDDRLQRRRDHARLLHLINAVALLRQMRKEIRPPGVIEADMEDVRIAYRLAAEIMGHGLDELHRVGRELLAQIETMVDRMAGAAGVARGDVSFTRRQIRVQAGWAHARIERYLRGLVDLEYLEARRSMWGRCEYRLVYGGGGAEGQRFLMGVNLT